MEPASEVATHFVLTERRATQTCILSNQFAVNQPHQTAPKLLILHGPALIFTQIKSWQKMFVLLTKAAAETLIILLLKYGTNNRVFRFL